MFFPLRLRVYLLTCVVAASPSARSLSTKETRDGFKRLDDSFRITSTPPRFA